MIGDILHRKLTRRNKLAFCLFLSLCCQALYAQESRVRGKVTLAKDGSPAANVTVQVKGTANGTVSDAQGNYLLPRVTNNAVLIFSLVGMKTHEEPINGRETINVTLEEEAIGMDEVEVIAVGYGTMKKRDLTGAVARVTMDDKVLQANTNVTQALTGVSGVNVQSNGGAKSNPTFSIRGQSSLSASETPLIVVDGIIYNGDLSNINMNDVETIDILKDASAAAVYGSRSANGVLIVTTKKGKTQKSQVSFDSYAGFQDMTNNPMRVMNADEFALRSLDWYWEQDVYKWYATNPSNADGRPPRPDVSNKDVVASYLPTYEEQQNFLKGNEIDWVNEVLHTAPMQYYNLGIQGGSENSNYYLSGSYSNVEGIQLNDRFKRFTVRSNLETKINSWLTLGLNASYSYQDNSGLPASLANARVASPLVDNKIGSPDYDIYLGGELYQPYPLINLMVDNKDISNELFAVGRAVVDVPGVKGLKYELNYSHTFSPSDVNSFYSNRTPEGSDNRGYATKNPVQMRSWAVNNIITYLRDFGDHQINSTLLFSRENITGSSSTLTGKGFDNESLGYNDMGLAEVATVASSAYEENSLAYMARLNYTYKSRYLLTGTYRRDGYSGFSSGHKWAGFPSLSLGWVTSSEPFMQNSNVYLKVRTSYGLNGNQGIGRYSSLSSMGTSYYVYGNTTATGLYPVTLGNSDLGWEKTKSFNVGFDYGFLNNRLSGSVDLYTSRTDGVLVRRQLPSTAGYVDVWANLGAIRNKGIDFELNTINFNGDFKWKSNFVFSINRDKIAKLFGGDNDSDIGNSWFVGEPISAIYDYKMTGGVWTEDEFFNGKVLNGWYPGQFRYADLNNDNKIDPDHDRQVIGYEAPNYRFSINNSLEYKNFSLTLFINSIQGGNNYYLANNAAMINPLFSMSQRMNNSAINPYWTPENPTNNTTGIYNNPVQQSGIYQSRSFVRLQDVSLAYKFSDQLLNKLKLRSLQVYVSSKNPYVWTNWQGWDPEIGVSDTPLMRSFIAGIRLGF